MRVNITPGNYFANIEVIIWRCSKEARDEFENHVAVPELQGWNYSLHRTATHIRVFATVSSEQTSRQSTHSVRFLLQ